MRGRPPKYRLFAAFGKAKVSSGRGKGHRKRDARQEKPFFRTANGGPVNNDSRAPCPLSSVVAGGVGRPAETIAKILNLIEMYLRRKYLHFACGGAPPGLL